MVVLCEEGAHDDDKKVKGVSYWQQGPASLSVLLLHAVFVCGWLACSEKGKNHLTLLSLN